VLFNLVFFFFILKTNTNQDRPEADWTNLAPR